MTLLSRGSWTPQPYWLEGVECSHNPCEKRKNKISPKAIFEIKKKILCLENLISVWNFSKTVVANNRKEKIRNLCDWPLACPSGDPVADDWNVFSKDILTFFLFLEQQSPSIPMCYCLVDIGNLRFVRDFNIHLTKGWDSHFIINMNKVPVHACDLLFFCLLYEKALIVRKFPEGIISNHAFLAWDIYLPLTWSDQTHQHISHTTLNVWYSWVYILFSQLHCKIINDKVCFLEKPLHPKKIPANMSVWPLEVPINSWGLLI